MSADCDGEAASDHPLAAVAALAVRRRAAGAPGALDLRFQEKLGVRRIGCETPKLWVLLADEDGSLWDKWTSDDPEIRFVKVPRGVAARGPEAILDFIAQAAADGDTP